MERKTFTCQINDDGRRLDRILRHFLKDTAMSSIYSAIRKGLIKVNGRKAHGEDLVKAGDEVSIAAFLLTDGNTPDNAGAGNPQITENEFKPEIVYENPHLIFINKPYGISVHGENSLENLFAGEKDSSLSFKSAPLHRLDRNTSGLLAFSRSIQGARWFSENIKVHGFRKFYVALIKGHLEKDAEYEDYLEPEETSGSSFHKMKVSSSSGKNKAITKVSPLAYGTFCGKDVTLSLVEILTGQKHQIRVQCAFHGFPLLGDSAYGEREMHRKRRFYLHAYKLVFPENPLDLPEEIICHPDNDFIEMLRESGIENISL